MLTTMRAINKLKHKHGEVLDLWGSIYDVPSGGGSFISLLFSKLFAEYLFIFMCNGAEPNALLEAVSQTPLPWSKTTSTRRWRLNALLTLCLSNVTKLSAAGLEKGARQLNKKTCCSISAFEYLRVAAFIWKANIYSSQLLRKSSKSVSAYELAYRPSSPRGRCKGMFTVQQTGQNGTIHPGPGPLRPANNQSDHHCQPDEMIFTVHKSPGLQRGHARRDIK